jgi:response regulator NasT
MDSSLRWRVAIVDDHERSRAALRAAIWSAGGEVIGEATRGADAVVKVQDWSPDIAVVAFGLPDGDGTEPAAQLAKAARCAIVLFTSHTETRVVQRAADAGVMAYLLKPLRREEVAPTLDIALARFREAQALRRTLEERKLIERAKGTLMVRYRLTEDEAFRRMRRAAMDSRRPMVDVARAVLVSESVAGTGPGG